MYEIEIREFQKPQSENLAVVKQRHPAIVGSLIRFECARKGLILVGAITQVLIDHTGYEFESVCVWVQIVESRAIGDD